MNKVILFSFMIIFMIGCDKESNVRFDIQNKTSSLIDIEIKDKIGITKYEIDSENGIVHHTILGLGKKLPKDEYFDDLEIEEVTIVYNNVTVDTTNYSKREYWEFRNAGGWGLYILTID